MVPPGFYPIKGGTETMVRNLSVELNRIGVHTDVMTFNMDWKWNPKWRGKTEEIDGITVFRIPALNWMPIEHSLRNTLGVNLIPGRFTNLLKEYDVIHFHEVDLSFPLFSFFVRKLKIFHLHGVRVDFFKRYHLSRLIFKHVTDFYICITRQMESDLAELGIARSRILHLPNAVDVELFHPEGEKEDNLILYLGRIVPVKGLHVLIESLRYLKESVHLVIVGPVGNLEYHQEMLKRTGAENQKGKHKITYLGHIPQAQLIELHQKAAIFILPSFWEAFPVVMLEAMACRTPTIVTPVGGVPEVVRNFENGVLVPVGDVSKLAGAIQYLLDNKDARIELGLAGRETVIKNFSVNVVAKRLRTLYEKIISH